jgi:hypothetical protein
MNPPPVEGWREMLAKTDLALSKLAPDAEEVEVALALTDFSTLALETENNCKIRLPKNQNGMLDSIVNEGAESIVRFLQSYLIVPIRRFMAKMSPTGFMVPKSWDLESFHRQDVQSILAAHNDYLIKFQRIQISPWLKSKLQAAVDQTREIIKFLQMIRPVQIPGGKQTYDFFLKFCLFAPLANFVDPNILPALLEEGVEVPASQVEEQALFPARFISDMIKRFFDEGFRFTPEQIRELIAKRSEMEKDNIIKKTIANTTVSKLEKGINKCQRLFLFSSYTECKYYHALYGGEIIALRQYEEKETYYIDPLDRGIADAEPSRRVEFIPTDNVLFILNISASASMTNGFRYIEERLMQYHNY